MPIYLYQHPDTGEVFEVIRPVKDRNKKYKSEDGVLCERIYHNPDYDSQKHGDRRTSRAGEKLEVFQADPKYVKKMNPKYVKYRDGHRERYDPTKHC